MKHLIERAIKTREPQHLHGVTEEDFVKIENYMAQEFFDDFPELEANSITSEYSDNLVIEYDDFHKLIDIANKRGDK